MPPNTSDQALYEQGGDRAHQVPRVCHLERSNTNFPMFTKPPKSFAVNLKTPLLAHSWNAGFSFHKCHMEEVVPYDFFMPQIFDGEEFTRFARLWTRVGTWFYTFFPSSLVWRKAPTCSINI